jgi:hypothetical protein
VCTYEEVIFHFNLCIQIYFILQLDYLIQNVYELPNYYLCELIWLNVYVVQSKVVFRTVFEEMIVPKLYLIVLTLKERTSFRPGSPNAHKDYALNEFNIYIQLNASSMHKYSMSGELI